jgi:hypothetical protein
MTSTRLVSGCAASALLVGCSAGPERRQAPMVAVAPATAASESSPDPTPAPPPPSTADCSALLREGVRLHRLDLLKFRCPDGSEHQVSFDFSADPREQAMQKELREGAGGRK